MIRFLHLLRHGRSITTQTQAALDHGTTLLADRDTRLAAFLAQPWRNEFGALICPCGRTLTDPRGGTAPCPRCTKKAAAS